MGKIKRKWKIIIRGVERGREEEDVKRKESARKTSQDSLKSSQ
jgi:hypothetical protein